ncbi:hypothetical protein [uncultured Adlercreutzia sp.]|uniref:hypothetical protein n=1 Tax=uncultured Adlercreutzia sp. TaxID=875803 RepID=UPI0026769895|nr:hypothetical protein [uncultured Adlercreutzia sp.]
MDAARRQRLSLISFCLLDLVLYTYGVISAPRIPSHIEGIALPLDFMAGIPLGFYLLVARPRRLTLLSVIPVIWIGYALSALALGAPDAGILPALLSALIPVELAIAVRECLKITRTFKAAKTESSDPVVWFRETMLYLVRKDVAANMTAAELAVWYYALLSWRKKPYVLSGARAFSYHNAGDYMNMMLGLALAFPVEIVAVHLLVSQWSVPAAIVVTALSVYAAIWLVGDARARMLRPIAVGGSSVRLECGIQMEAVIPISHIEAVSLSGNEIGHIEESDRLNYGTFYRPDAWLVMRSPVEVRTLLGTKHVRAIGVSVDDPKAFAAAIKEVTE